MDYKLKETRLNYLEEVEKEIVKINKTKSEEKMSLD